MKYGQIVFFLSLSLTCFILAIVMGQKDPEAIDELKEAMKTDLGWKANPHLVPTANITFRGEESAAPPGSIIIRGSGGKVIDTYIPPTKQKRLICTWED